jgi:hypothetical protein
MMRRRGFVAGMAAVMVAPRAGHANQPAKPSRTIAVDPLS